MTAWIVNQRTGGKTGPFNTYVEAAVFRRDVLRGCPLTLSASGPSAPTTLSSPTCSTWTPPRLFSRLPGEWGCGETPPPKTRPSGDVLHVVRQV
jgi:hypothetical protein